MAKLTQILRHFILIIFFAILLYLYLLSIHSTTYITIHYPSLEGAYYLKDSPIIHILFGGLIIIALTYITNMKKSTGRSVNGVVAFTTSSIIMLMIFAAWILIVDTTLESDQWGVWDAAMYMHQNYNIAFEPGQYMYNYPHQYGLLLMEYWIIGTFGKVLGQYVFMGLNGCALILIYLIFQKMVMKLGESKGCGRVVFYLSFFFLPLSLYVTFIYGTLIGLACVVTAFYLLMQYLKTRKAWILGIMSVLLVCACLMKKNYLIALIAVDCVLLLDVIDKRKMISLFGILLSALLLFGTEKVVNDSVERITGIEASEGIPSITWIAMGLHDSENAAEGWYDISLTRMWEQANYNPQETSKIAKEDLLARLQELKNNPSYAVSYFAKKNASQWNNPTFQGFWIYQLRKCNSRISGTSWYPIVRDISTGNKGVIFILNLLQSFILFGALCYVIFHWRGIRNEELILPICFIGGFLFHSFWEAKAQYALPYFALLIPIAVMGIRSLIHKANRKQMLVFFVSLWVLVGVTSIPSTVNKALFQISENEATYQSEYWK